MRYRNKKVKDVPSEELLFELLQRNEWDVAPYKSAHHGEWISSIIGIGKDHTADIRLPKESLLKLHTLVGANK